VKSTQKDFPHYSQWGLDSVGVVQSHERSGLYLFLAVFYCLSVPLRKWPDVPAVVRWSASVFLESDKHPLLVH
jgi:hypothetical protein